MFTRNRKKSAVAPPTLPFGVQQVDAATLLRAIPHLHPKVERISDRRYGCLLAWPVVQPEGHQPRTLLGRFFATPDRKRRLVLDDLGRRTVELMDGRRSLGDISLRLVQQTGRRREGVEQAVLAFVGQLVRRNVIALVAPQE